MSLNYWKDKHKNSLSELLQKYKEIFDGTLGIYIGFDYTVELHENAKPYDGEHFPILTIYEPTLKIKVDRLIKIGLLKEINNYQRTAPTFIIPKKNMWYSTINLSFQRTK